MHAHAKQTALAATTLAATTLALLAALLLAGSRPALRREDRVPPSAPGNVHVDLPRRPASTSRGSGAGQCPRRRLLRLRGDRAAGHGDGNHLHRSRARLRRERSPGRGRVRRTEPIAQGTTTVSTAACPDTRPPTTPSGFRQTATTQDSIVLAWTPSSTTSVWSATPSTRGCCASRRPRSPRPHWQGFPVARRTRSR